MSGAVNVIERLKTIKPEPRKADYRGCGECGQKVLAATKAISGPALKVDGRALILRWANPDLMNEAAEAMRALGAETFVIQRGSSEWDKAAVRYIESERPKWVFAWQRLFGAGGAAVAAAAQTIGAKLVIMDFSVWPHYSTVIFDPRGENAASALVGAMDWLMMRPEERAAVEAALPQVDEIERTLRERAAKAETQLERLGLARVPKGAVLLTLQRKDKVLDLDAPENRRDHARLARELIAEAAKANRFLAIKPHPQLRDLNVPAAGPLHQVIPATKFGDDNDLVLAWLMVNCSHLVTVNSTTWTQAVAVGKPVNTLGDGWYTGNRVCTPCKTLKGGVTTPEDFDAARARRFVALMLSRSLQNGQVSNPEMLSSILRRIHPPRAERPFSQSVAAIVNERIANLAAMGIVPGQNPNEFVPALEMALKDRPLPVHGMIEIGCRRGGSLYVLAGLCSKRSPIIAVDRRSDKTAQEQFERVLRALVDEGYDVKLVTGDSHSQAAYSAVRAAMSYCGRVELLHVDGDHSAAGFCQDIAMYAPLVTAGSPILCHDIANPKVGVKELWDAVSFGARRESFVAGGDGTGVMWRA